MANHDLLVTLLREAAAILRAETDQRRRDEFSFAIDNFLIEHAAAKCLRHDALMKLLEACDVSDDCQYGTLSTAFVRDLVREAVGPKCERCHDTGWIQGDPVIGISDEPCGCAAAETVFPAEGER